MPDTTPILEMRAITKRFPGVLANDRVNFDLYQGEVHALLGENGAGKSTLMSALCGLYRPDEGEIRIKGQPVDFASPRQAMDKGIGMIHQHFMLVPTHTVTENVILGLDSLGYILDLRHAEQTVADLGSKYGLKVDPKAKIWQLSVGEQQRVEIIKVLYRNANVLIMDEPTAVLTPQEVEELFRTLRNMAAQGQSIVFISHKLDEVMAIADRITVLRDGRNVATVEAKQTDKRQLARLMVGRDVLFRLDRPPAQPGAVVLDIRDLCVTGDRGLPAVHDLSLEVHSGEIVGIAGVAGNGQAELAEAIAGLRGCTSGKITVNGRMLANCTALQVIDAGLSYIPEDRNGTGTVPNMTVAENLILKSYRTLGTDQNQVRQQAEKLIKAYNILTPDSVTPVRLLSGGNVQKLILAREITANPSVIVAMHPTRGLDVGATEAVHRALLEQRSKGTGILLISEDLDEVLALSDRIAVIYEGQIMGVVPATQADVGQIGLMMAGTRAGSVLPEARDND